MVGKAQSQVAPTFPMGKNRGQVLTFPKFRDGWVLPSVKEMLH